MGRDTDDRGLDELAFYQAERAKLSRELVRVRRELSACEQIIEGLEQFYPSVREEMSRQRAAHQQEMARREALRATTQQGVFDVKAALTGPLTAGSSLTGGRAPDAVFGSRTAPGQSLVVEVKKGLDGTASISKDLVPPPIERVQGIEAIRRTLGRRIGEWLSVAEIHDLQVQAGWTEEGEMSRRVIRNALNRAVQAGLVLKRLGAGPGAGVEFLWLDSERPAGDTSIAQAKAD